jgi:heme exporter protein D
MQWGSLSEFLAMGGYGFYVWVSFGATAVCLIGEVILLHRRKKAVLNQETAGGKGMPA